MPDNLHNGICSLRVRLRTEPTSDGRTDKTNTRRFVADGVQQAKPKPVRTEKMRVEPRLLVGRWRARSDGDVVVTSDIACVGVWQLLQFRIWPPRVVPLVGNAAPVPVSARCRQSRGG